MTTTPSDLDPLLKITNRSELRAAVARRTVPLGLPAAQTLAAHAAALAPAPAPLRMAVVHTYTSELLEPWLGVCAALGGLALEVHHAPYGLALHEARAGSALVNFAPDLTLLMLQRTDLHPDFAFPLTGLAPERAQQLRQEALARLQEIVGLFRAQPVGHLVLSLLPSGAQPALGLYEAQGEASELSFWAALNAEIAQWLRQSVAAASLLDLDEVVAEVGRRRFFDQRYWFSSRYPFTPEASMEVARRVMAIGQVLKTPRAKVIVLDADNTLWGGVIGEDGMDGIGLGPDYPGNAFLAFQRRLLDLQQRGFILAMCSKNNLADVDQVLREHPHMLLKEAHFAARRVNWVPKPDNLMSLAEELNLGLDSFIFVDDSDHECSAVRERLPQVEVVQVPKRAVDVPGCLNHVARLEVLSLTAEDRAKTALYAQERERKALLAEAGAGGDNGTEYLQKLGMRMRISLNPLNHLSRLSQLTQKTNQFNLSTRRYDEQQMREFIERDDWLVADFSLADVFGDAGIVGLALVRLPQAAGEAAELNTFLMSCRVIGRRAEDAFLHALMRQLADRGVTALKAAYLPTAKNVLVKDLLPQQGFDAIDDSLWQRDLVARPPQAESDFPIAIELLDAAASAS